MNFLNTAYLNVLLGAYKKLFDPTMQMGRTQLEGRTVATGIVTRFQDLRLTFLYVDYVTSKKFLRKVNLKFKKY